MKNKRLLYQQWRYGQIRTLWLPIRLTPTMEIYSAKDLGKALVRANRLRLR